MPKITGIGHASVTKSARAEETLSSGDKPLEGVSSVSGGIIEPGRLISEKDEPELVIDTVSIGTKTFADKGGDDFVLESVTYDPPDFTL